MTEQECLDNLAAHLPEISNDMMVSYNYMVDHNLCDFSVSEHKAPNGFTTGVQMYNAPLMFNDSDGTYMDMKTMIHEFGHYNQMYYQSAETWKYNKLNLDLAEIHSQGLEMLYVDYYDDIFGSYSDVMTAMLHYGLVGATVDGCKEDEFQHRVYENPDGLTVESLNALYYEVCNEYGDAENYNSYYLGMYGVLEPDSVYEWVEIPHTFQSPEYYISYSVSAAAVYELYDGISTDRDAAIDTYLDLVNREFQDDFQATVVAAGLNNPIANPRFDLYADDVRASLGLPLQGHKDYSDTDTDTEEPGDDIVPPADDDTADPDDTDIYPVDQDDTPDSIDDDTVAKNVGLIVAIVFILAGAGLIVLILLIVIIILIVSGSKKKKRAAAAMAQYEQAGINAGPGGYGQPVQNGMNGQPMQGGMNGTYGQPMQNGMNGMNGMSGQPMQGGMSGMNTQPVQNSSFGNPSDNMQEGQVQNNVAGTQENAMPETASVTTETPVQTETANAGTPSAPADSNPAESQVQVTEAPSTDAQVSQTAAPTDNRPAEDQPAENQPPQGGSEGTDKKE